MFTLQYVTGKGFVSPAHVRQQVLQMELCFLICLKPVTNRLGATGEFQLADPKLSICTCMEIQIQQNTLLLNLVTNVQVSWSS